MKTLHIIAALVLGIFIIQCNKDDIINDDLTDNNDTISTELKPHKGSVGIIIDARTIAKKGYHPQTTVVKFTGEYEKFSNEIDLNSDTYISILKFEVDSLTDNEYQGFLNGVDIEISIVNESSKELGMFEKSNQIIDASNTTIYIDTELPEIAPTPTLNAESPFLIQSEDSKKVFTLGHLNVIGFPPYPRSVLTGDYDYTNEEQKYYFKPVPGYGDSCYYILGSGGFAFRGTPDAAIIQSTLAYGVDELTDNHVFVITPDKEGWVKIRLIATYNYLKEHDDASANSNGNFISDGTGDDLTRFRLINADLQWEVTDLGTSYDQPILPESKLEFAYKATLSNCSGATLTETIGRTETRTQSFTSGMEESLELFSSHEASVEVTAGVEVDAKFFGKGATYNLEVTAGYTYTTSETTTSTEYWESTKTTEVEISREREVEIGPYLAVEAYDAVETLSNVKLPFSKKFRIKAQDSKGNQINGDELVFQLFTNQFGGVISKTEDDYIEVTVKGTTSIDKMMEVDTKITEIEDACN